MLLRRVLKNGRLQLDSKEVPQRVKNFVISSARPTFGGVNLVDIKFAAFPIAFVYVVFIGTVFVVMLYYQVQANFGQNILSYPRTDGKDPNGMKCESIVLNQTQVLYATYDGIWSTERAYEEKKSIFLVNFNTGQGLDKKTFADAMLYFRKELESYQIRARSRSVVWSLMVLCSISIKHEQSNIDITLSTDATFIFTNPVNTLALSNMHGVCVGQAPPTSSPKAPLDSSSPNDRYLYGAFDVSSSSILMNMPFTINRASVFGNASVSTFSTTFTPAITETCPNHGTWVRNVFLPADGEFRNGVGSVDFDVRGVMLAAALNLNLVSTSSVMLRSSSVLEKIGFISLVDPYYHFPPMQRIYCINKSSEVWQKRFPLKEQKDQENVFRHPTSKYEYPNVCYVVSTRKTRGLQMFYPVLSQLKTDRLPCYSTPAGCPKDAITPEFSMRTCECPNDATDTDCNRLTVFLGLIYDTNIMDSANKKLTNRAQSIIHDNAVGLGIDMQQRMLDWKKKLPPGSEDNTDLDFMKYFAKIFEATMLAVRNPDGAHLPRKDAYNSTKKLGSANEQLRKAWTQLGDRGKGLSAIIFRSIGVAGATNFILPISKFNVELSDLVSDSHTVYYEPAMDTNFKATMCQNVFSFSKALEKLADKCPLPLEESYRRCTRNDAVSLGISLGSAWSFTNLLIGILWAVMGWVTVKALRYTRQGTDTTVVSKHTKDDLVEIFQDLKDEALLDILEEIRAHLPASALASREAELWARFCRLHRRETDDDTSRANDLASGLELSERLNARQKHKHGQIIKKIEVLGDQRLSRVIRTPSLMRGQQWQRNAAPLIGSLPGRSHPLARVPESSATNPLGHRSSVRDSRRFSFKFKREDDDVTSDLQSGQL